MHCKLSDFGLDETAIEQLFGVLDTNHDGRITHDEIGGCGKYHRLFGHQYH